MNLQNISVRAAVLLALSPLGPLSARALDVHNVPKGVQIAQDQGQVERGKDEKLTVFLKMHNQEEYDKAVEALYDPASPTYHKWFTDADFTKYAPTAAELKTVKDELSKHGLTVLSVDPQNLSIRVHGAAEKIEEAFQTQLHTFTYKNTTFQAHVTDARLIGDAGALVDTVAGLDRHKAVPQLMYAKNPKTGKPLFLKRVTASTIGQTLASSITNVALTAPTVSVYGTQGSALPIGVYYGLNYDAAYSKKDSQAVAYTPKQLQAHYGLTSMIKQGYDGTGQTIALVEGFGYAQAESDANLAAKTFGLPPLTSANFEEIYPDGVPPIENIGITEGWNIEIALDIQSAHAIAPGAKIIEVAADGQDDEDFIYALNYIINHKLAHTVSSSWGVDEEFLGGPPEAQAFNTVLQHGAAVGISFQFSTGDSGDNGLGSPVGDVAIPADAPYATAVGGTSVLNNPNGGADVVAGWGNLYTYVNDYGAVDPPNSTVFPGGGAGGGESVFFAKPSWQKDLPGSGRELPDVSALADPSTGFPIIYTAFDSPFGESLGQFAAVYGGTSLASPIFTATWAIADQYNGKPLGFAAPLVAKLKPSDITDVLATNPIEISDVTGTVYDAQGATYYSADGLFENANSAAIQPEFLSALFSAPADDTAYAITFGTDTSLTVGPGWDNVTGYGEPNGLPFIQGVTGKTAGAPLDK
ncbi:S53 family peptidase [Acidisarcina polymorpha]|nr:S53 family peptidase [Acidisarcina polymorpha]